MKNLNLSNGGLNEFPFKPFKQEIENFSVLPEKNIENKSKTLIVIDGQNVALRHSETQFSAKALQLVIQYWLRKGHPVHVLLPDYCFDKEEVAKRKKENTSKMGKSALKHIPDDVDLLLDLKRKGFAFGIPNWNYDDSYIIEYCKKKNGYIVTNDRYNDHINNQSRNDREMKEKVRNFIRNNCISFTFIADEFIPNPDFLRDHNID